ncbi:MAG: M3 family oligoendopeptidase [Thermotogaceae bacterium]|nr:M3 family oligoendopeptidase [Thermotogaceae bacterium]
MEWDFSHLYNSDKEAFNDIESAIEESQIILHKLESINDTSSHEDVANILERLEKILIKAFKAEQYASLKFSKNMRDESSQKMYGVIRNKAVQIEQILAVMKAKFAKVSDKTLKSWAEKLTDYRKVFERIIEEKKHILSEDAERILATFSNTRRYGVADLYEKITSSYIFEIDGKKMTGEQVRALRYHPDSQVRRKAMKIFFKKYEQDKLTIEGLYNLVVKDWDMEARLRNYPAPISMRNFENETDDETVQRLIDVTTENTKLVQKYYKWKAEYLGEELTLADIYAPLLKGTKEYSFEDAKRIVLDAYYEFSRDIGKVVESFFEERRIDVFPAEGKRGGAFCSYSIPNYKPYVLLNFTGKIRDVMTLAHELGHGVHGTLSSKQNIYNYHTPLTMAEIASVFGEFLVFDKLRKELEGEERKAFIASKIEDIFATMFRQSMFARFEMKAHEVIEKEGFASYEQLSNVYRNELEVMFGDSVKITEEYHKEWSSIPHIFFAPFYVYAYNFANALVIALYQKYLEEGTRFVPKYIKLLESGGKGKPEKLLEEVGVNLRDENFWQKAFDYIDSLIKEVVA